MSIQKKRFERIVEHAFTPSLDGQDQCAFEEYPIGERELKRCSMPEIAHEWTVDAVRANPPLVEV